MIKTRMMLLLVLVIAFSAGTAFGADIKMKISGKGAVDANTIKAGEPVSVDIYWSNDKEGRRGFTCGFKVTSKDIKEIVHVVDSGKGLNPRGDIKGHNGWQDASVWDFAGVWTPEVDWDGKLPDQIGFGGAVVKKQYGPHELTKVLSFDIIVPEAGTIVIDSAFFPPGGYWKFGSGEKMTWDGPHTYKVVK
ncbi:MAG: hypothetical protein KKA42_07060 [candidate division Zixibacteria bacterium]|nr:hypothetical protein [candidate division Zixibacteria bacterium]